MQRRKFIGAVASSVIGVSSLAGCISSTDSNGNNGGDEYPTEDIEITVPTASGGGYDAYARLSVPYWEDYLDGTVIVENRPGGGTSTGTSEVYRANPDGYSMLFLDALLPLFHQVGRDVDFDLREMSHIGSLVRDPNCLLATEEAEISGWDDFANRAEDLRFGTAGVGTGYHIYPFLLGEMTGVYDTDNLSFVHHDGTGEVIGGVERGDFDVMMPGTTTSGANVVQSTASEFLVVFSEPHVMEDYLSDAGTPTQHYSTELELENIEEFNEVTTLNRIFTGPPDVSDDILQQQRDAFANIIEDEEFLSEAEEADRPIIQPEADAEAVQEAIERNYETLNQEPYITILQKAFE